MRVAVLVGSSNDYAICVIEPPYTIQLAIPDHRKVIICPNITIVFSEARVRIDDLTAGSAVE